MKKRMPLFALVGSLLAILAVVFCALPAYVITSSTILSSSTSTTSYSLFQLMFGCDVTTNSDGDVVANAGLIIAFILVILAVLCGIAAFVISTFGKKKNCMIPVLVLAGGAMVAIVAGILFFCTLKMTGLSTGTTDLYVAKGTASLGAAPILVGILAILSGLSLAAGSAVSVCKK